jgi:hypothetical protein
MELVGEEKRIQALFSEARLADEQTTPSFVGVWNRAQAKTNRTQRAFNLSFVAATALLVCALVSLAWWVSRSRQGAAGLVAGVPTIVNDAPKSAVPTAVPTVTSKVVHPVIPTSSSSSSHGLKATVRRPAVTVAANQKTLRDAKAIEDWQSPTATLLDSSSDALLKSVPQLNQTVDDLKSFLPSQPK